MTTPSETGMRHVEHHMGTAISLQTFGATPNATDRFFEEIRELEARFSRYRKDSEVMRIERGELLLDDASPQVREVMVRCDVLRSETGGAFDHRPVIDGRCVLDPNALAKGWIIDEAALHLQLAGVRSFVANAGGDVVVGAPPPGETSWRVGIAHPNEPGTVFAVVDLVDAAVATSGRYERGDHIRRAPEGSEQHDELTGVTVIGPELATADALATAVLAGGEPRPDWWPRRTKYGIIAVFASGRMILTEDLAGMVHLGAGQCGFERDSAPGRCPTGRHERLTSHA